MVNYAVVHLVGIAAPVVGGELVVFEQTVRLKQLKVDKVGISCIYGEGLVRRIAVACGRKGQYLPALCLAAYKKVNEVKCLFAHFADSVLGRQA